ncbi:hypothetical protein J6G99_07180 [bacterium]|nr:hypothetical protein [bacterium]
MSSIIDAFNETFTEKQAYLKFFVYAIPVFFTAKAFINGQMSLFWFYGFLTAMLIFALLTSAISNVRMNKQEILTFNPFTLLISLLKGLLAMIPQLILFFVIGNLLIKIQIPIDIPHIQQIYEIIVYIIISSIILTSYMAFAKYLEIKQAYNYKVILESCIDIIVNLMFFIPQWLIANTIIVGPILYIYSLFHIPYSHWTFIFYCSMVTIANISIIANYLSQTSYELIKGEGQEYNDNYEIKSANELSEEEIKEFKKRKR